MRALLVLALNAIAWADPVKEAADAVLAAKDADALAGLARKPAVDPWLVADELCARGEAAAAEAYAKAVGREKLAEYVRARGEGAVAPILALAASGEAHRAAGRLKESARDFRDAAQRAERLGWLARANEAWNQAGASAFNVRAYESALECFERAGTVAPDAATRAGAHENAGAAYVALLRLDHAIASYEAAASAWEALGNRARAAGALGSLGLAQLRSHGYAKALESLGRALEMNEDLGLSSKVAENLESLGNVHSAMGQPDRALEEWTRSLEIRESAGDAVGAARSRTNIGTIHMARGDYPTALEHFGKALAGMREAGQGARTGIILANIGNIHNMRGEYPEALSCLEEAQRLLEDEGNPMADQVTYVIGLVHLDTGNYGPAEEHLGRFLERARAQGDPAMVSTGLQGIAGLRIEYGQYGEALALLEEALAIEERLERRSAVALCLMRIGRAYHGLGRVQPALEYLERSMELSRELGNQSEEAKCLGTIGSVYMLVGDLERARDYQLRCLRIEERLGARSDLATTLANIGNTYLESEDFETARSYYERALEMHREVGDSPGVAVSLANLAIACAREGRVDEARKRASEALAINEALGSTIEMARTRMVIAIVEGTVGDHVSAVASWRACLDRSVELGYLEGEVSAWSGLAGEQLALGEHVEAVASAKRAVAGMRHFVRGLGVREAAHASERYRGAYRVGIRASMEIGSVEDVNQFLEAGRAMALLESLGGREALREVVVPEALRRLDSGARAAEAAARARYLRAREGGDRSAIQERRAELDAARASVEEVIARIRREARGATSIVYPEPLSLAAIQGGLGGDEALVLYQLVEDESVALVVTSKSADARRLGPAAEIEALCATTAFEEPGRETADALAGLSGRLVEPLGLPEGIRRVLVSPDGALAHVPFSALFPGRDVVHVPSATTWGFLRDETGPPGEAVLALGGPEYGARLRPLPGSADEAKAVGDVVLLGGAATEAGLRECLAKRERWRAVHFACHGLLDPEHPLLSSLAVTADGGDDGLLSSLEVFEMRIPADLVVLSACDTARGKVYRSEGVMGFTRAFMYAGAPRVIVSLWRVDDRATRALMTRFYELWKGSGVGAAEALRRAQEHVRARKEWEHPYFWAAWQLWGLGN